MNNVHFLLIKIAGYRGRNFTLKMHPRGQNTIFVMDGNTGKTTTIELLRWCLRYAQSEAENKFEHMWAKPAHVLDDTKKGHQVCEITIQWTALDNANQEHFFQFKRVTEGQFDSSLIGPNKTGDIITSIHDTLEINHGKEVKTDDDAHFFLERGFRFNECAEYFCFDGEKARDIMQLASDSGKIGILLDLVNRRTTHPKLEEYKEKLNGLRERVLAEAGTKISDKALKISIGKLRTKIRELTETDRFYKEAKLKIAYHALALRQLKGQLEEIQEKISFAKAKETIDRNKYETQQKEFARQINEKRSQIYDDSQEWISSDVTDAVQAINRIKTQVREKGKLPEPYRRDLIQDCLIKRLCQICGRPLDKKSEERIKGLERQVAPHEVHVFLSNDFTVATSSFDPNTEYEKIKELIKNHGILNGKIASIKLSEKDAALVAERESLNQQIYGLQSKLVALRIDASDLKQMKEQTEKVIKDLQEKNVALKENKIILDKIDESVKIIDDAAEKIKIRATDILSRVISEGISSILGPKFSAKLSQSEGLMLGEDGFYGKEKGGYSGRLILSYCFAEAMTLIDPIIVDTPVGNIGSQREALATHLKANHKQVILLCLPTEIISFAHIISPSKPIEIENL